MYLRTSLYSKSRFQDCYITAEIVLSAHLSDGEWASIFYDDMPEKMMHRHRSFGLPGKTLDHLYGMASVHAYSLAEYYESDAQKIK